MYEWLVEYARGRAGAADPFRQAEVGELKTRLDAARLLLYHTALLFPRDYERALLGSLQAKWLTQEALNRLIEVGGDVAGSTALFRDYPLERFYRDMHLHATHSRQVVSAQVVGAAELGAEYHIDRQR
jgi:alkylation response protein AidB-like acyl-CoA dehydrogenase